MLKQKFDSNFNKKGLTKCEAFYIKFLLGV